MELRDVALAVVSGLATFVIVGVAVTEVTAEWIEFSLFVGIPAGVISGVAVTLVVYLGLTSETPGTRRPIAIGLGTFGGVFILVLVLGLIINTPTVTVLLVATAVGVVGGIIAFARGRQQATSVT